MGEKYRFYVGIDWATEAHQVCVMDADRRVLEEFVVEHSGKALGELADSLSKRADGDSGFIAVAIEVPRGAVVETLVERGFQVFSINPKQLDRFRDRHSVAGAKDDRRDAFVLADSLCTDEHCFRRVRIDDPLVIQIRELARIDDDLRGEKNRLCNRLRGQLHRYYPQMLRLSSSVDEPWFWTILEKAPTPSAGARLAPAKVNRILREHRIRRLDAKEVIAELRKPTLYVAPGTPEAAVAHIELLLPRLRLVHDQRKALARRIEHLLACLDGEDADEDQIREHRDVKIIRSMPGVGRVVAATMLAEASQPLAERDYHSLRSLAGVAPVTRASGKRSGRRASVAMRRGCNHRLRNAIYHWARVAVQRDALSRASYAALRARGHTHGRALRSVGDRLLRILMAMLTSGTLYDPLQLRRSREDVAPDQRAMAS